MSTETIRLLQFCRRYYQFPADWHVRDNTWWGGRNHPARSRVLWKAFYTPFGMDYPVYITAIGQHKLNTSIHLMFLNILVSKRPKKERRKVFAITALVYSSSCCLQRFANGQIKFWSKLSQTAHQAHLIHSLRPIASICTPYEYRHHGTKWTAVLTEPSLFF